MQNQYSLWLNEVNQDLQEGKNVAWVKSMKGNKFFT